MIGIFGGTFDPIHLGHLNAINELQTLGQFERIHWVLSARPPHKGQTSASIEQRFEMLQLALADYPQYIADDTEIKRLEKSYTYETVQHFKQFYSKQVLCLIIGSDSLATIDTWYRYQELIDQVHIVVMARPGYELLVPDFLSSRQIQSISQLAAQQQPKLILFEQSQYDVSSTKIRALLTSSLDMPDQQLKELLPDAVINYIQSHQSYKIVK